MDFTKKTWVNVPDPSKLPDIPEGQDSLARFDAENMNRIEEGVQSAHVDLDSHINNKSNPHGLTANGLMVKSIGGGTPIKENDDLNSYIAVGNYCCTLTAIAATLSNCPTSGAFVMTVGYAAGTTSYLYQEITHFSTGIKYYRTYTASNKQWSDWRTTYSTSNKPTARDVGAIPKTIYLEGGSLLTIEEDGWYYGTQMDKDSLPTDNSVHTGFIRVIVRNENYKVVYWRPYNSSEEYSNVKINETWLGWVKILTNKGGTIKGDLTVNKGSTPSIYFKADKGLSRMMKNVVGTSDGGLILSDFADADNTNNAVHLALCHARALTSTNDALQLLLSQNGEKVYKNIFGEHNKPTQKYNGTAAAQTLNVGGIGNVVMIYSHTSNYLSFLTPSGGFSFYTGGNNIIYSITPTQAYFADGVLHINTNSSYINTSGVEYFCKVL